MSKKDKEYTIDYFEYQANETRKKYIEELDKVLAIYKRALELACEDNKRAYELQYLKNDVNIGSVDAFKSEYLRKAKEELEEQK